MSNSSELPRSPELMSRDETALLVVDVQEKLIRLIPEHSRIIWNIRRLIDGAKTLGVPAAATEQYPQGLGPTIPELAESLESIPSKMAFSCGECGEIFAEFKQRGISKILVVGVESEYICSTPANFCTPILLNLNHPAITPSDHHEDEMDLLSRSKAIATICHFLLLGSESCSCHRDE